MKPKEDYLKNSIPNKSQSAMCGLAQLSISQIKERQGYDESLDFQQQKQLINNISKAFHQINDEYGLQRQVVNGAFYRKLIEDHQFKLPKGDNHNRLRNSQSKQKNICFNKQLRRKKISSKSKDKMLSPSSLLTTCNSLKLSDKILSQSKKNAEIPSVKQQKAIQINIRNIAKRPKILLKLYEAPLFKQEIWQRDEKFKKIYYQMADDFKVQLSDLNHNLNTHTSKLNENRAQHSSSKILPMAHQKLKRSEHLGQQKKLTSEIQSTRSKRSWIQYSRQDEDRIVEVKKPLSIDCRNSSFYSSRTDPYESPFSKDSNSTATHRVIKRSQIYGDCNSTEHCNSTEQRQYFLKGNNKAKLFK